MMREVLLARRAAVGALQQSDEVMGLFAWPGVLETAAGGGSSANHCLQSVAASVAALNSLMTARWAAGIAPTRSADELDEESASVVSAELEGGVRIELPMAAFASLPALQRALEPAAAAARSPDTDADAAGGCTVYSFDVEGKLADAASAALRAACPAVFAEHGAGCATELRAVMLHVCAASRGHPCGTCALPISAVRGSALGGENGKSARLVLPPLSQPLIAVVLGALLLQLPTSCVSEPHAITTTDCDDAEHVLVHDAPRAPLDVEWTVWRAGTALRLGELRVGSRALLLFSIEAPAQRGGVRAVFEGRGGLECYGGAVLTQTAPRASAACLSAAQRDVAAAVGAARAADPGRPLGIMLHSCYSPREVQAGVLRGPDAALRAALRGAPPAAGGPDGVAIASVIVCTLGATAEGMSELCLGGARDWTWLSSFTPEEALGYAHYPLRAAPPHTVTGVTFVAPFAVAGRAMVRDAVPLLMPGDCDVGAACLATALVIGARGGGGAPAHHAPWAPGAETMARGMTRAPRLRETAAAALLRGPGASLGVIATPWSPRRLPPAPAALADAADALVAAVEARPTAAGRAGWPRGCSRVIGVLSAGARDGDFAGAREALLEGAGGRGAAHAPPPPLADVAALAGDPRALFLADATLAHGILPPLLRAAAARLWPRRGAGAVQARLAELRVAGATQPARAADEDAPPADRGGAAGPPAASPPDAYLHVMITVRTREGGAAADGAGDDIEWWGAMAGEGSGPPRPHGPAVVLTWHLHRREGAPRVGVARVHDAHDDGAVSPWAAQVTELAPAPPRADELLLLQRRVAAAARGVGAPVALFLHHSYEGPDAALRGSDAHLVHALRSAFGDARVCVTPLLVCAMNGVSGRSCAYWVVADDPAARKALEDVGGCGDGPSHVTFVCPNAANPHACLLASALPLWVVPYAGVFRTWAVVVRS